MGAIRLLLAVAVVVSHGAIGSLYGFRFLSSALAVQTFFILSGFYMALVLDTTYRGRGTYWPFLGNRALRLLPIYWLVCVLTVVLLFVATARPLPPESPDALSLTVPWDAPTDTAFAATALANVALVGQDAVHFFVATPEGVRGLDAGGGADTTPLYRFLLIPQAWTLSLELVFYAVAPFLVRRSSWSLAALTLASLALLGWMHAATDLMGPPAWEFKFLPTQMWTFTLGILAYRSYRNPRVEQAGARLAVPALIIMGFGLFFGAYGGSVVHRIHPALDQWLVLPGVVILLPLAFRAFERGRSAPPKVAWMRRTDTLLGDLSYAVYISHVMVYLAIYVSFQDAAIRHANEVTATAIVTTLGVSWLLVRLVHMPVETVRGRLRARATMPDAPGTVAP